MIVAGGCSAETLSEQTDLKGTGDPALPCSVCGLPSRGMSCRYWLGDVICKGPGYPILDFVTL